MNRSLLRARLALLVFAAAFAATAFAHEGHTHGDHEPHHGGAVLMYQTIHYETVLLSGGGVQIWITDEMRNDLPAATVSDVAVEIERPGTGTEAVDMTIAKSGDYWEGKSRPVTGARTTVRVAYVLHGEPVLVNIPGSMWPALGAADKGTHAH